VADFGGESFVEVVSVRGRAMAQHHEIPPKRRARRQEKSRRPKFIALGVFVAAVIAWHFVPAWRKHVLESAFVDIHAYRIAHGHFPTSQAELDEALDEHALARRGCYVEYDDGPNFHTLTVIYRQYKDGRSFSLGFNHDCFCDFPDTSRYEAVVTFDCNLVEWDEWCD
jgi:hypothetical protein